MFTKLSEILEGVNSVGIAGHTNPDGDAIGSAMGIYNYLRKNYLKIDARVFLEEIPRKYKYIYGTDDVISSDEEDFAPDLFIAIDSSTIDRIGFAKKYFDSAKKTVAIDHHISNENYADENLVVANASSTCEVVFDLLDVDKIDKEVAEALYTGIVTDSGVFKYSATSRHTMEVAGRLIDYGIDITEIIDGTFYRKTYAQNQFMGRILLESILLMDGKVILGYCTKKLMDFYNVSKADMDGIVDQLRLTEGVEVAIFVYAMDDEEYKVSMRSVNEVDVSKIAVHFGGGGHVKAAGFSAKGRVHDIVNAITAQIELQM